MGNEIFIKDKRVSVKALRSGLEATQKLQPLIKGMQKFPRNGEFPEYVLSRTTKIIKANI